MLAVDAKLRARTAVIVVALRQQLKDLERLADADPPAFARFARATRQCLRLHEELAEIWAADERRPLASEKRSYGKVSR